ncbi:MAG: cation diffusion facilitator family transporter [Actinomycetota bacterium]
MTLSQRFEMPPDKEKILDRAVKLEWLTIAYLSSAVFFIYLTLGSSQAMKTAWFEDMLSLIPSIAFLVAARVRHRAPNKRFPYGFHRAVSIAFLCAAVALTVMGVLLFYDSLMKLIAFEHPSIGVVQPFGEPIWLGWFMIPALLWSAIPAVLIGRAKIPLARALHDKVLYADSQMNKADWLTAGAALLGVIGIGVGLWWADAVAAMIISLDIAHDGIRNLKAVVADLMDSVPTTVDHAQVDPLPARLETELGKLPWIESAKVRMREEGHVYFGEVFAVFTDHRDLHDRISKTIATAKDLDWRVHDLVVSPVASLEDLPDSPDAEAAERRA